MSDINCAYILGFRKAILLTLPDFNIGQLDEYVKAMVLAEKISPHEVEQILDEFEAFRKELWGAVSEIDKLKK